MSEVDLVTVKNFFAQKRTNNYQTCSTPCKKLTIRNFEKLPEVDYRCESWAKLESGVLSILNSESKNPDLKCSLEDLYQSVRNLCIGDREADGQTYQKLKDLILNYIKGTLLPQFLEYSDQRILPFAEQCWNSYCTQMRMIRNIFLYLDRTYVLHRSNYSSIWYMSLEMFCNFIILHENVLPKIQHSLLEIIANERKNKDKLHRTCARNIIRMLVDLNIYDSVFEREFLRESTQFYSAEAVRNIRFVGTVTSDTVVSYLDFIDEKLNEESDRMMTLGLELMRTHKKLLPIMEKELIESHLDVIVNGNNFDPLFADTKYLNSVKLAYDLLIRVPNGSTLLCTCFNQYVKNKGKQLVHIATSNDLEKEKMLVEELITFKDQMNQLVRECFSSNERFAITLKDAFETFINIRTNKVAELIAKYVDSKLRSIENGLDISFDLFIDKVLTLFRFIHGKDIFEAFYQRDLSKRLLGGKSASVDSEKLVLLKLKQECGGAFTSKLEAMFKDMELSRELTAAFKNNPNQVKLEEGITPIDLNVSVLTTGIWPSSQPVELRVPDELRQYEDIFTDFYNSKHSGRKLTWQHSYGHCLMKANFAKGSKELQVSFIQALVLLQFNNKTDLSFDEIQLAVLLNKLKGPQENELRRTMQSLACGKVRVLTKTPKGRDILDTDQFTFDDQFEHKLFRIKINQVQWKETFEENVSTQERVSIDRQYQLDAAIVRIMKARKTLQHTALVSEVYEKINFPATSAEVKKRIDSLLERDYIRRDKEEKHQYNYVA